MHSPAALSDADRVNLELQKAVLRSERTRVVFVGGFFGLLLVAFGGLMLFAPDLPRRTFGPAFDPRLAALAGLVGLAMQGAIWWRLGRITEVPNGLRYLNAFVEVSLPSLAMAYVGSLGHPIFALSGPPAYLYFLFIVLSILRLNPAISLFTGLVAATEYALLARWALAEAARSSGLVLDPILAAPVNHLGKTVLLVAAGAASALVTRRIRDGVTAAVRSVEDRNHVVELFGRHVSPAVVDKLLAQPNAEGEMRQVCVMFLDIRDFTTFSEGRRPEEVVSYLNALFDPLIDCVNRHHGFINKFLGDGFMAVFGAPLSDGEASRNAVRAARDVLVEVQRLAASGAIPPTRVGIGLHAGEAVTGNVGSARRKEYTIIGDVVNLASRIEGLNKQFQSQLLVSAEVRAQAGGDAGEATSRGPVQVKGRAQPVEVFQLA